MHLLLINLYELGQFLRIVLWIFLPLFVIILLITTYIHHRRRSAVTGAVLENGELVLAVEGMPDGEFMPVSGGIVGQLNEEPQEEPDGDNLYKGLLWMKQKFEEYREQADAKIGLLKEQLDQRTTALQALKEELTQSKEKVADLTVKLENNMSLLMNIHKELDKSLNVGEQAPAE